MKKQIIIATLAFGSILFGTNNVQAQGLTDDAITKVNISLKEVISIDPGSAAINGVINFLYDNALAYNSNQNWNVPNSLIVTSSRAFNIHVKANGDHFIGAFDKIELDVLTIIPTSGSANGMTALGLNPVKLTNAYELLVDKAELGSAVTLDLDYFIPSTQSSTSKILGKPADIYTQTITYTATTL